MRGYQMFDVKCLVIYAFQSKNLKDLITINLISTAKKKKKKKKNILKNQYTLKQGSDI